MVLDGADMRRLDTGGTIPVAPAARGSADPPGQGQRRIDAFELRRRSTRPQLLSADQRPRQP